MRIAVANWSDRIAGGAETYLSVLLPALARAGVELAFWSQTSRPSDRPRIVTDAGPAWVADELGMKTSVERLRAWRPDVVYSHGFTTTAVEESLLDIAPAIYFAHNHNGTCITGGKTTHRPHPTPCHRTFGPACLLHYYPRRCGGLSPVTMVKLYRLHSRRRELLRRYETVLCASEYMRGELVRHGLESDRVVLAPYPVPPPPHLGTPRPRDVPDPGHPWRILFAGRLEPQKGADLLLDALPDVLRRLDRPVEVVVAGDGRERARLEARAATLAAGDSRLRFGFTGWLDQTAMAQLLTNVHLLAFPSVWPEPFGILGVEAGHAAVPAAAFDVGGVTAWLTAGHNGTLAPGDPPTAAGFADAVTRALDPAVYPALAGNAVEAARRFSVEAHLGRVRSAVERVVP